MRIENQVIYDTAKRLQFFSSSTLSALQVTFYLWRYINCRIYIYIHNNQVQAKGFQVDLKVNPLYNAQPTAPPQFCCNLFAICEVHEW